MAKILLLVESKPESPEHYKEYHAWHERTHNTTWS